MRSINLPCPSLNSVSPKLNNYVSVNIESFSFSPRENEEFVNEVYRVEPFKFNYATFKVAQNETVFLPFS